MFRLPTRTLLEPGCRERLPGLLAELGAKNVLVVTDKGVSNTPWFDAVTGLFGDCDIERGIAPNPKAENIDCIAKYARQRNYDAVIGIGGGSALDAAKVIAMLMTNDGPVTSFEGKNRFPAQGLPFIAIPTTCGTGSEVTWVSVISVPSENRKISIKADTMFPWYALIDADLIETLPSHLIASTGMDAMTHALEAIVGKPANPVSNALATRAIGLLFQNLAGCASDPSAPEPRKAVMHASSLAGMAFGNADVGAVHCLSESIGGLLDLPHGLLNALLLIPVLTHQQDSIADPVMEQLGIHPTELIERLKVLISDLSLPSWQSLNVPTESFLEISKLSEKNGSNASNRQVMLAADYIGILDSRCTSTDEGASAGNNHISTISPIAGTRTSISG